MESKITTAEEIRAILWKYSDSSGEANPVSWIGESQFETIISEIAAQFKQAEQPQQSSLSDEEIQELMQANSKLSQVRVILEDKKEWVHEVWKIQQVFSNAIQKLLDIAALTNMQQGWSDEDMARNLLALM